MATSLPEQLVRTRRFTSGVPTRFTIARAGAAVVFLRSHAGDDPAACLRALDLDSGVEEVLADPGGQGIDAYATDAAARLAVFAAAGGLWVVDVVGGDVRRLPVDGPVADPRLDADGLRISYVREGALRVVEVDGTGDRSLVEPDGPDVGFGVAEHTDVTAPGDKRGHWWAPDGARLLVARADSSTRAVPAGWWCTGFP